LDLSIIQ
jgi:hypothetical protein